MMVTGDAQACTHHLILESITSFAMAEMLSCFAAKL